MTDVAMASPVGHHHDWPKELIEFLHGTTVQHSDTITSLPS